MRADPTRAVTTVAVVIPARDEEELVGDCLESVAHAVTVARRRYGSRLAVKVVLVADGCTDDTVAIASGIDGVEVVETAGSNVGAARKAGVDHALAVVGGPSDRIWIANTDADSLVPPNWLTEQLELAAGDVDLMIGTVHPTFDELSAAQVAAWRKNHRPGVPNGHAHGANLGIRASAYLRAGGFPAIPEHEDNDLVDRVRASGARIVASDRCDVETSGRRVGRTNGGYARFLHGGELESRGAGGRAAEMRAPDVRAPDVRAVEERPVA
jgi:glycosyltransferase involved in cell wall biosynthesis